MRQKLNMMAGPVDLFDEVREAHGSQPIPSWHDDFVPIYMDIVRFLKHLFDTSHDLILLTAPGSGTVEACVSALFAPGERVVAGVNGFFSQRMVDVMRACAIEVVVVEAPWGRPVDSNAIEEALVAHPSAAGVAMLALETGCGVCNPVKEVAHLAHNREIPVFIDAISALGAYHIPIDEWELDVVCTSSNKALESAPGIGIAVVGERGWRVIEQKREKTRRGWYYDLLRWKQGLDTRPNRPYQITLASSLLAGLRASLQRIVNEESREGHWARYRRAQEMFRAGIRALSLELLVEDAWAAPTVTAVCRPSWMNHPRELVEYLETTHDLMITTGAGGLANEAFRVGHMGLASSEEAVQRCLDGIEEFARIRGGRDFGK